MAFGREGSKMQDQIHTFFLLGVHGEPPEDNPSRREARADAKLQKQELDGRPQPDGIVGQKLVLLLSLAVALGHSWLCSQLLQGEWCPFLFPPD